MFKTASKMQANMLLPQKTTLNKQQQVTEIVQAHAQSTLHFTQSVCEVTDLTKGMRVDRLRKMWWLLYTGSTTKQHRYTWHTFSFTPLSSCWFPCCTSEEAASTLPSMWSEHIHDPKVSFEHKKKLSYFQGETEKMTD